MISTSCFQGDKRRVGKETFVSSMASERERASTFTTIQSIQHMPEYMELYARNLCICTRIKRSVSSAHCSRIAREIGECPRNNLCCWARATSDVPYLDARSALIRRWTVSHRMAREYKEEGRDVSACRSASLSCRRQTRPLWFVYMAGEVPASEKGNTRDRGKQKRQVSTSST